jgi:hypothetical protein
MRFSTIQLKLRKTVLIIIAFYFIDCAINQTNKKEKDIDFLASQGNLH